MFCRTAAIQVLCLRHAHMVDTHLFWAKKEISKKTSLAAAYPTALCKEIALWVADALCPAEAGRAPCAATRKRKQPADSEAVASGAMAQPPERAPEASASGELAQLSEASVEELGPDASESDGEPQGSSSGTGAAGSKVTPLFHGKLERAARDNRGSPLVSKWGARKKSFTDGAGLCSPGRWKPSDRGTGMPSEAARFTSSLRDTVCT